MSRMICGTTLLRVALISVRVCIYRGRSEVNVEPCCLRVIFFDDKWKLASDCLWYAGKESTEICTPCACREAGRTKVMEFEVAE